MLAQRVAPDGKKYNGVDNSNKNTTQLPPTCEYNFYRLADTVNPTRRWALWENCINEAIDYKYKGPIKTPDGSELTKDWTDLTFEQVEEEFKKNRKELATPALLKKYLHPKDGLRFPFSLTPLITLGEIETDYCTTKDEDGRTVCFIEDCDEYSMEINGWRGRETRFAFFEINGLSFLYDITVVSSNIEDCDAMAMANVSLQAMIKAVYEKKKIKKKKGKHYGNQACKYYMSEGNTFYSIENKEWKIVNDTYFSEGNYHVYISYVYLPLASIMREKVGQRTSKKVVETLDKL